MEQNNTLKYYLIIGLIICFSALFNSCDRGDYRYTRLAEYHFVNETNYFITYPIGFERFNIAPKSTRVVNESVYVGGRQTEAKVSDYISPLLSQTATLTIKFDNAKCLIDVKADDEHGVRNIKNFNAQKLGENHYKFTYTFTEADYNRATTCP